MKQVQCHDLGDGITQVILNRAPVNALSAQFLMEFSDTLDLLSTDPAVRGVIISSNYKVFSAGLDLKEALSFERDDEYAIVKALNVAFLALFSFPKPTVAAINGSAIAGGLFFVLASDYRIAVQNAKFGLAEVRVGADFPVGPMEIARATLSADELRRLMLTGQPISTDAAVKSGFVDAVASETALLGAAVDAAKSLADSPPIAYASVKRQIRGDAITRIQDAMQNGANTPEGGWFNQETKPAMRRMLS
jgi:enoyl-CoA hydratase/carnithine racemase